jgi:hypothetical protein
MHMRRSDTRGWDSRLNRDQISHELSAQTRDDIALFIRSIPRTMPVSALTVAAHALPRLRHEIENCRSRVDHEERMALIRAVPGLDFHERRLFAWIVANMLGQPVAQNWEGDRVAVVYARPGSACIADGAPYHQTCEGGAAHSDNVSLPDPWDYLVFSCFRPAWIGGESILISAFAIHEALLAAPEALEVLRGPFWWEYRGISDGLFQAPIITYSCTGEPRFRYIRRYLEAAHLRAGEPLTLEQRWALDTLDAITDRSHLQFRMTMREGEILITYDSQVLHARNSFCDPVPDAPVDANAAAGPYRFFDRVWATRRPSLSV